MQLYKQFKKINTKLPLEKTEKVLLQKACD